MENNISTRKNSVPRYENVIPNCVFLGTEDYYDLYVCKSGVDGYPTIIARKSGDPWDYESGIKFAISGENKPLLEALKRAVRLGCIRINVEWIFQEDDKK